MKTLTLVTLLGCGLAAGVFFAFSAFVMEGLGNAPPRAGIAAMQAINVSAVTPPFMLALFGTALCCVALVALTLRHPHERGAAYRLIGALCYLFVIGVTIVYHVPRNDALAALPPAADETVRYWHSFVPHWTAWNHLRTAGSFAALALLAQAYRLA